jgi:hypothetical protein
MYANKKKQKKKDSFKNFAQGAGHVAQAVECLPSKCEALCSIPSNEK